MEAIILCGPPACGKSTQAKHFVEVGLVEINRDNIRFNNILPGGDWTTYKFSKKNEKEVTRIWWELVRSCAFNGKDIIISDTLCNSHKRQNVVDELKDLGYSVDVVVLHVPLKTLIERDSRRGKFSVGEAVITRMFNELNKEVSELRGNLVNKGEINAIEY